MKHTYNKIISEGNYFKKEITGITDIVLRKTSTEIISANHISLKSIEYKKKYYGLLTLQIIDTKKYLLPEERNTRITIFIKNAPWAQNVEFFWNPKTKHEAEALAFIKQQHINSPKIIDNLPNSAFSLKTTYLLSFTTLDQLEKTIETIINPLYNQLSTHIILDKCEIIGREKKLK